MNYFLIAGIIILLAFSSCGVRPTYTGINQASSWLWNEVYNEPDQTHELIVPKESYLDGDVKAMVNSSKDTLLKIRVAIVMATLKKQGPVWIALDDGSPSAATEAYQVEILLKHACDFYE